MHGTAIHQWRYDRIENTDLGSISQEFCQEIGKESGLIGQLEIPGKIGLFCPKSLHLGEVH